jgi:hypothetical protein
MTAVATPTQGIEIQTAEPPENSARFINNDPANSSWLEFGTNHVLCNDPVLGGTNDFMEWFLYACHPSMAPCDWKYLSGRPGSVCCPSNGIAHGFQIVFEGFCPGTPCGWHAILDVTEVWSSGATNDGGVSTEAYYEIFGGNQNTIGTRSFRRVMTGTAFRGWDNFTISVFGPNACCFGQPFNPPPSTQLNYREPF